MKFTKQGTIFLCVRLVDPVFYDTVSSATTQQFFDMVDTKQLDTIPDLVDLAVVDTQHDISVKGAIAVWSTSF